MVSQIAFIEIKPLGYCLSKCSADCTKSQCRVEREASSEEIATEEGSEIPTGKNLEIFQFVHDCTVGILFSCIFPI